MTITLSTRTILLTIITFLTATAFLVPLPSEAGWKSVSWDTTVNKTLNYHWNFSGIYGDCSSGCGWAKGLLKPNVTVTYYARVYNRTEGAYIDNGATISVGDKLELYWRAHANTHISWFGTEYMLHA